MASASDFVPIVHIQIVCGLLIIVKPPSASKIFPILYERAVVHPISPDFHCQNPPGWVSIAALQYISTSTMVMQHLQCNAGVTLGMHCTHYTTSPESTMRK